jgi:hypothetical protein
MLNTGAAANQELVSFGAVGAKVKIGTLELGGEGRNFAFMGDGSFKAKTGFGVFLSIGGATGDGFQWPSFLPIKIESIGIRWIGDVETDPTNFELILSASITAIKGVSGLQFTGSVEGIRINPSLLAQGKMPITRIDSLGVTVKGAMFGGEIDAGIVGGILRLDANYNIIGVFDDTTPVQQRVFYLGLQGGFSMAGMAGFTIRVGLSELGPLSAFINIEVPGGILLEPTTGLTINDFSAGVEFFKTLPSVDDPFALRSSAFQLPTAQTADEWLNGLQRQVAAQAKAISVNPALNGFTAAFTAPMTITGGAKVYTIYTSQAVFNGEVIVKISTDGKFLIVGKLNFAADNISISGRLYADLSKIASGSATVLFLADVPDQVRVLTIYGKLKMGFKNASGEDVVFDVLDVPATQPGSLKPTATIMNPATAGGSSAVTTAQSYIDVLFTAPKGGGLDLDSIMQMVTKISLHRGVSQFSFTDITPMSLIEVDGVLAYVPLRRVGNDILRGTEVVAKRCADTKTCDLPAAASDYELMLAAVRKTNTTYFRFSLASPVWTVGDYSVTITAGAFKGLDGSTNDALEFQFGLDGATARLSDPGAGGTIDINVLNQRNWIDVAYVAPGGGLGIDVGSIVDLAPEFVLAGAGLGTLALDPSRAPTLVSGTTYRYWLTGLRGTGAITLTYLAGTWAFNSTTVDGQTATAEITLTDGVPSSIAVTLPTVNGLTLDPGSVDLGAFTGTISSSVVGWTIVFDPSRAPVLRADGKWELPVLITPPAGSASTATTTATVTFAAGGLAYTGQPATGTQSDTTVDVSAGIAAGRTFIDVQFRPVPGTTLDVATIDGNEFLLSGFGGSGVSGGSGDGKALQVGENTWRFILTGQFRPGEVLVSFQENSWSSTARGPPVGATYGNRAVSQRFRGSLGWRSISSSAAVRRSSWTP